MDAIARLLLARYRLALTLDPTLARARSWYASEGDRIRAMAAELGVDGRRATDAAAVLSPAGRWDDVVVPGDPVGRGPGFSDSLDPDRPERVVYWHGIRTPTLARPLGAALDRPYSGPAWPPLGPGRART